MPSAYIFPLDNTPEFEYINASKSQRTLMNQVKHPLKSAAIESNSENDDETDYSRFYLKCH